MVSRRVGRKLRSGFGHVFECPAWSPVECILTPKREPFALQGLATTSTTVSFWQIWIEAARPKTLPAAIIPVMVGTALAVAHGQGHYGRAAICLGFALLVQIGTNFANDYFDFVKGADTAARVGPRRAVAAGLIAPRTMLGATGLILGLAFLVGLLLVRDGGWILLPVGVVSIVCAIAYTGGPFPLGYN